MKYQAEIFSAHLVEKILLKAIKLNLDLNFAFNSKLFTSKLNSKKFQQFESQFPQMHQNKKSQTFEYASTSLTELVNSPKIIDHFTKIEKVAQKKSKAG